MSADTVASQAETLGTLKGAAGSTLGYGPAAYVVTETPAIVYSSPSVFIPLGVAVLVGIYHLILIYEKLKK